MIVPWRLGRLVHAPRLVLAKELERRGVRFWSARRQHVFGERLARERRRADWDEAGSPRRAPRRPWTPEPRGYSIGKSGFPVARSKTYT